MTNGEHITRVVSYGLSFIAALLPSAEGKGDIQLQVYSVNYGK